MDYTTLKNNVRTKLRVYSSRLVSDDAIGLFLNDGQRVIESKCDWPFAEVTRTFSTATGSQEYTLSTVMREVTVVEHPTRDLPLEQIDYKDSRRRSTSSGTPYAFYIVGKRKMGLVYIPNNVSTITYSGIRVFPSISATTESIIPEHNQHLLEDYALGQCYKSLNMTERGNDKLGEFYDGLEKMTNEYMMRVPGGDYRIKDPDDYMGEQINTFNYYV